MQWLQKRYILKDMDGSSVPIEFAGQQETSQQREERAMGLRQYALSSLQAGNPDATTKPAQAAAQIFDGLAREHEGKEETRNEWLRYLGLAGRTHAWAARGFESKYRRDKDPIDLDGAIFETMESLQARNTVAEQTQNEKPLALPYQKLGKLVFERAQVALAKGERKKAKQLFDQARLCFAHNGFVEIDNLPKSRGNNLFKTEEYAQYLLADFALRVIDGNNTSHLEEPGIEEALDALANEQNMEVIRGESDQDESGMSLAKATWITELQTKYALLLLEQSKQAGKAVSREKAETYLSKAAQIASEYNAHHPGKGLSNGHLQFIVQAQEQFRQAVSTPPALELIQGHFPEVSS